MKASGGKKKPTKSKSRGISGQYLIAAAILLVGIAVSALVLTGVIPLPSGGEQQADSQPAANETVSGEPTPDSQTTPEETPVYTVRFYDGKGEILTQGAVTQGYSPEPPEYEAEGMRFRGWDKEIFFARSDLDLYPRLVPLGEEKNIVYANAVYADGDESICVTPRIAGTVDCCCFSVEVSYDSLLLDYTGCGELLPGVTVTDDAEAGVLTLSWEDDAVLAEACALAQLYFSCTGEQCYTTTMNLVTRQIQTLKEGNKVYTESMAYDFEVFILNKK